MENIDTVADLIIDTGMLMHSDFDKIIPKFEILNKLLLQRDWHSSKW